jgi:hypothetical protein
MRRGFPQSKDGAVEKSPTNGFGNTREGDSRRHDEWYCKKNLNDEYFDVEEKW